MRVRVIESFKTAKGNISEGTIIDIPEAMFDRLKGKVEPLHKVADAILQQTIFDIQSGGIWQSTPDVEALENEINRLHRLLMDGLTTLEAFKDIVEQWKATGSQATRH